MMGIWSSSLFGNDTACDVKDTYTMYLEQGGSDEDAYEKTCKELRELIGTDEEPLFWYALAAVQWRVGRLIPQVKKKALSLIETTAGIDLFEESKKMQEKWKITLLHLKEMLNSEMPSRKVFKVETFDTNLWNIGDVYAYRFSGKCSKDVNLYGKYILFHKIAEEEAFENNIYPRLQIYNRIFDTVPKIGQVNDLKILPFVLAELYVDATDDALNAIPFSVLVTRLKKSDYKQNRFSYIGNVKDVFLYPIPNIYMANCLWHDLERSICELLVSWNKYDYSIRNKKVQIFKK